jgi:hypothetical protein
MQDSTIRRLIQDFDWEMEFEVNEKVLARFVGDGEIYIATIIQMEPKVVVQWDADNSITEDMEIWQLHKLNGEHVPSYYHPNFSVGDLVKATAVNRQHASFATIKRIDENDVLVQWQQGRKFTSGIQFDRLKKPPKRVAVNHACYKCNAVVPTYRGIKNHMKTCNK